MVHYKDIKINYFLRIETKCLRAKVNILATFDFVLLSSHIWGHICMYIVITKFYSLYCSIKRLLTAHVL